ncbi:CFS1-like protein [Phlebopus sp. FC_14]|nr:CFS1-like protein [Phlebopus sp. FC_14]
MEGIKEGDLRVITLTNSYRFPPQFRTSDSNVVESELRVINDLFWIRLCMMGDLGFSEAYMYGEVECNDLVSLFKAIFLLILSHVFLKNRETLFNTVSYASSLFTIPQKLTSLRFLNTISNSQSNISAHYDLSNAMFAGFLSEDMTYSCAIFEDLDGDICSDRQNHLSVPMSRKQPLTGEHTYSGVDGSASNPFFDMNVLQDELHEAQLRKLNHVIDRARISSGHRVLEIGSGWGSLAILIAKRFHDTTVDTLTLSVQQQILAQARVEGAGLQDRINVHLMDYRAMPSSWRSSFDRVISIEMIENVGAEFLAEYWRTIDWALKKDDGAGVVQVITIPEARFERYAGEIDFIRKWVFFPGGLLPTPTILLQTMEKGSSGRLIVDSVSNIGPHYARTLREWRRRFLDQFKSVIVPALKAEHPSVMDGPKGEEEIQIFKRKWLCNCYCEVGFATRMLGDHIITFTREGYDQYGCNVFQ